MPHDRIEQALIEKLDEFERSGRRKARESVITGVVRGTGTRGPRYRLAGAGERDFIRMNANNYLGLSLHEAIVSAQEIADRRFGTGPGAVRFISGTWAPHVELEARLAAFHRRQAAMIFSSAYAAVIGILSPLIDEHTAVISDELNHNCIINAIRLAAPKEKHVYRHLDMTELETALGAASRSCRRAIVVTDGVFSMRGDHAPLGAIVALARQYDSAFAENVLVVVDDSHGVGAFGASGRGSEEYTECEPVDLLVATLGKAFGVNGGYVAGSGVLIDYLRETSPLYVYSNPITPGEAAASVAVLDLVDSDQGQALLDALRERTRQFEAGLVELGLETIPGEHPIVPWMVRDKTRITGLVRHLRDRGVLATGLNFPVVPRGDESIRFQVSAEHTRADIDEVLAALRDEPRQ